MAWRAPVFKLAPDLFVDRPAPPAVATPPIVAPPPVATPSSTCRTYAIQGSCRYGDKCRYAHDTALAQQQQQQQPAGGGSLPPQGQDQRRRQHRPTTAAAPAAASTTHKAPSSAPSSAPSKCRAFAAGSCRFGDKCRYSHISDAAPPATPVPAPAPAAIRAPVVRPAGVASLAAEIEALQKRYPTGFVTSDLDGTDVQFSLVLTPSDPSWPAFLDLRALDVQGLLRAGYPVTFPPILSVGGAGLPDAVSEFIDAALAAEVARRWTVGAFVVRDVLRWLDNELQRLFTEASRAQQARTSSLNIRLTSFAKPAPDLAVAPQVPETLPQATFVLPRKGDADHLASLDEVRQAFRALLLDDSPTHVDNVDNAESDDECDAAGPAPMGDAPELTAPASRGLEVRLDGLRLIHIGLVNLRMLACVVRCVRCRGHIPMKIEAADKEPRVFVCPTCSTGVPVALRSMLAHLGNNVLGHVDAPPGYVVADLALTASRIVVDCEGCAFRAVFPALQGAGSATTARCQQCHLEMSLFYGSLVTRQLQPGLGATALVRVPRRSARPTTQTFAAGEPLPMNGACRHYRQSHRWFRFPCCGRAFACDICHDDETARNGTAHEPQLASHQICGFCSREQRLSSGGGCESCGRVLAGAASKTHWEGGKGCRDATKMDFRDKHKYTNSAAKTQSAKSSRVGQKGKEAAAAKALALKKATGGEM